MAISFFTYSKKETSPLWVRYREGKIDAKARTPLIIQTDRLSKGQILKYRIKQSDNAEEKARIRDKNKSLDMLQIKMNDLQRTIQNALNNRDSNDVIDKDFMKAILYPDKNTNLLSLHIDNFLNNKKLTVKESSYKLYIQLKRIVSDFEQHKGKAYLIKNVDLKFSDEFKNWMKGKGYSITSIKLHIGTLMQVLRFASERGANITNKVDSFRRGLKKPKTLNVYLSFDEIETITNLPTVVKNPIINKRLPSEFEEIEGYFKRLKKRLGTAFREQEEKAYWDAKENGTIAKVPVRTFIDFEWNDTLPLMISLIEDETKEDAIEFDLDYNEPPYFQGQGMTMGAAAREQHKINKFWHLQRGLEYKDTIEEKPIVKKGIPLTPKEAIARDWLVISCFTAQRVSDMFKFNSKDISKDGDWITVQQTKNETSAKISVPIMPQVREILNKYNGEFPPTFGVNAYHRYLKAIKKVCKKAGLD